MSNPVLLDHIAEDMPRMGWILQARDACSVTLQHPDLGKLIAKRAFWWPEGAHPLDDEPALDLQRMPWSGPPMQHGFRYHHADGEEARLRLLRQAWQSLGLE